MLSDVVIMKHYWCVVSLIPVLTDSLFDSCPQKETEECSKQKQSRVSQ